MCIRDSIIPSGDFVLHSGDRIHITAEHIEIERFFRVLGLFRNRARTVMIIGGSRLAYYLAKELISIKVRVKIIERDKARCEYLCDCLLYTSSVKQQGKLKSHWTLTL